VNRSALVTGASRGIGLAIARALAGQGVRVALVARNAEKLNEIASSLGAGAFAVACDVTDEAAVGGMATKVRSALGGPPDVVVNNAGVFRVAKIEDMPAELFAGVLSTNVSGPFLIVRAFVKEMRERGSGHFITIGSTADRHIFTENGAYAPAKYALRAFHEVLREELRGTGVRNTLVSPASVDTSMWDGVTFGGDDRITPSRDVMLRPENVADAVMYALAQPASVNIDELRLSHS
jgi:NADP-dependent 3-hydroxy acid dehydrogenase YdfG